MPAILTDAFAVNLRLDLLAAKDRIEQTRNEGEYPNENINQPSEAQPIDQAVMLVLHDGNGLNADVCSVTLRADAPCEGLLLLWAITLLIHGNSPFYHYALSARMVLCQSAVRSFPLSDADNV